MQHINKNHLVLATMAGLLIGTSACSHGDRRQSSNFVPSDSVVQNKGSTPDQDATSLVLNYEPGQYLLTEGDRVNLSSLIRRSNFDDSTDRLEIAVWSDQMLPYGSTQDLSDAEQRLANQRIDQIQNFLKTRYDLSSAKVYNMAEGTNWLARAFKTRDAEMKSAFSKEEAPPMSDRDFKIIRDNGAASRAVLVITHKDE